MKVAEDLQSGVAPRESGKKPSGSPCNRFRQWQLHQAEHGSLNNVTTEAEKGESQMRLLSPRALTISATMVWQRCDLLEVDGQDTEEEDPIVAPMIHT
jgi:hypothetical protein